MKNRKILPHATLYKKGSYALRRTERAGRHRRISRDDKSSTAEHKEAVGEEILTFLREDASADSSPRTLVELDLKTIRIIGDFVELLIRKNLIARKRLRAFIHDSASILDDTEIL